MFINNPLSGLAAGQSGNYGYAITGAQMAQQQQAMSMEAYMIAAAKRSLDGQTTIPKPEEPRRDELLLLLP
jgi:hypothetical protein